MLFDKTGTLTMARPPSTAIEPAGSIQADELLALAAAAGDGFGAPAGPRDRHAAKAKNLTVPAANDF